MIFMTPGFSVEAVTNNALCLIEQAGRTCYKSEANITSDSVEKFVRMIIKRGHESVLEHASATVRFVCDRGVSHEFVRHRLASYSQESTRYCNYKGGVAFIIPPWVQTLSPGEYVIDELGGLMGADYEWATAMGYLERTYLDLLELGWRPEQARSVLPNSLKTEIVMTANFREWRHFFQMRTPVAAHPQARELAIPLLGWFQRHFEAAFEDIDIAA